MKTLQHRFRLNMTRALHNRIIAKVIHGRKVWIQGEIQRFRTLRKRISHLRTSWLLVLAQRRIFLKTLRILQESAAVEISCKSQAVAETWQKVPTLKILQESLENTAKSNMYLRNLGTQNLSLASARELNNYSS